MLLCQRDRHWIHRRGEQDTGIPGGGSHGHIGMGLEIAKWVCEGMGIEVFLQIPVNVLLNNFRIFQQLLRQVNEYLALLDVHWRSVAPACHQQH